MGRAEDVRVVHGSLTRENARLLGSRKLWVPIRYGYHTHAYRIPSKRRIVKVVHQLEPITNEADAIALAYGIVEYTETLDSIGLRTIVPDLVLLRRVVTERQRKQGVKPEAWSIQTVEWDDGHDREFQLEVATPWECLLIAGDMFASVDRLAGQPEALGLDASFRPAYDLGLPTGKILRVGLEPKPANYGGSAFFDAVPCKLRDGCGVPIVEFPQPPLESREFALSFWRSYTVAGLMMMLLAGCARVRPDVTWDFMAQAGKFAEPHGLTDFIQSQPAWLLANNPTKSQKRDIVETMVSLDDAFGTRMAMLELIQEVLIWYPDHILPGNETPLSYMKRAFAEPVFKQTQFFGYQHPLKEGQRLQEIKKVFHRILDLRFPI